MIVANNGKHLLRYSRFLCWLKATFFIAGNGHSAKNTVAACAGKTLFSSALNFFLSKLP